jgi:CubicO group peptidase (beta-lactamase class C family)
MLTRFTLSALALAVMVSGCSGQAPQPAVYPGAEWTWASSPERLGWSSEKLALARAFAERIGSAAVMIVDNGVVVDGWGDLAYRYPCHSMRKSLMSALYGIYVAEGRIDLTRTLADLGIDELTPLTEVERTATIADLLAARSGVYLPAAGEDSTMIALRPERGSHLRGTFWYYNNWDFNALGTIFDQLSGEESIYTAFAERIAGPIGMQDFDLNDPALRYSYESYSMHPYYNFRMSTRDLARFGLLFLRQGRWGHQQVIPADWVRESTSPHSTLGPDSGYGYMWWTGEGSGGFPSVDEGAGAYSAQGIGGHTLIVMPSRNLVVVHRSETEAGRGVQEWEIGTLLWLILDAAGEGNIGAPPRLEQAVGTRLTGDSLQHALLGATLRGTTSSGEMRLTFEADGHLSGYRGDILLWRQRWCIDGDTICIEQEPTNGGHLCFQVIRDGNRILLFDLEGFAVLQLEATPRGE